MDIEAGVGGARAEGDGEAGSAMKLKLSMRTLSHNGLRLSRRDDTSELLEE